MLGISDGAWSAVGLIAVACIAAVASIGTAIIGLFNRRAVRDMAETNTTDHGTVALALGRLQEEVHENHRRNGERFERLGHRMGDIAARQEQTNERIDRTNDRIDKVIEAQGQHLQHHLESHKGATP